ncbi:flavin-containing monooxygenase 1-like [Babylonia areolata]|uniref:flavin-containing monooxygenase 1-like n=1 Tax=Babylonia areolata TaxID=304850 RepID=UPI003FD6282D
MTQSSMVADGTCECTTYQNPKLRSLKQQTPALKLSDLFTSKLGVAVTEADIEAAHRTGSRTPQHTRPRPMIVRFLSRRKKDEVLANRRKLKGNPQKISIAEDLTSLNFKLLKEAKEHSATLDAWSSRGKIFAKIKNGKTVRWMWMLMRYCAVQCTLQQKMREQSRRKVAIVGCGAAGLTSIKACLEEGLQPHCFEINSDLGGVWYTPDTPKYGNGPVMYDNLVTNISKATICFSDFPMPASYPPFLPHRLFQQYLQSYAEHFKLVQHVSFNTKVLDVRKTDDYNETGRWVVTTCKTEGNTESDEKTSETYDGVILCQGFFTVPFIPDTPGLDEGYQGRVSHANSYRDPQPYKGRTVLVVGTSASGGDVACDIAPVAKQVYLSVRHGCYVVSRFLNGLTPWDFSLTRMGTRHMPPSFLIGGLHSQANLNPVASGLQCDAVTPPQRADLMINDLLPSKVITGQVKVVSAIERVTGTGEIHLKDGKVLKEVDDIIFATGYKNNFDAIDPSIMSFDHESGRVDLYKMMYPTSLSHDTLAVVGFIYTIGGLPPVYEVQARLAARVLAGRHRLPDRKVRQQDVDRTNQQQFEAYGCYKYICFSTPYTDEIAAEIGVAPDWWRFLLRGDVKIALAVLFGPAYPFHYRLLGPHAWPGAREATEKAYRETVYSIQHRTVGDGREGRAGSAWGYGCLVALVPVILAVVFYFGGGM